MKFKNKASSRSLRLCAKQGIYYFEIGGHFGLGGLSLETQNGNTGKTELTTTKSILRKFKESNIKDFENSLYLCEELWKNKREVYDLEQEIKELKKELSDIRFEYTPYKN